MPADFAGFLCEDVRLMLKNAPQAWRPDLPCFFFSANEKVRSPANVGLRELHGALRAPLAKIHIPSDNLQHKYY